MKAGWFETDAKVNKSTIPLRNSDSHDLVTQRCWLIFRFGKQILQ
jgi:hypothetical protein